MSPVTEPTSEDNEGASTALRRGGDVIHQLNRHVTHQAESDRPRGIALVRNLCTPSRRPADAGREEARPARRLAPPAAEPRTSHQLTATARDRSSATPHEVPASPSLEGAVTRRRESPVPLDRYRLSPRFARP